MSGFEVDQGLEVNVRPTPPQRFGDDLGIVAEEFRIDHGVADGNDESRLRAFRPPKRLDARRYDMSYEIHPSLTVNWTRISLSLSSRSCPVISRTAAASYMPPGSTSNGSKMIVTCLFG